MKRVTPFHTFRGRVKFPWRPTTDRAFIFSCPPPTHYIPGGLVEIPEVFQAEYIQGIGILLAIGLGFYDDKGKWHSVPSDLVPGVYVKYDQNVPWRHAEMGLDGKMYSLILCGAADISGVVEF